VATIEPLERDRGLDPLSRAAGSAEAPAGPPRAGTAPRLASRRPRPCGPRESGRPGCTAARAVGPVPGRIDAPVSPRRRTAQPCRAAPSRRIGRPHGSHQVSGGRDRASHRGWPAGNHRAGDRARAAPARMAGPASGRRGRRARRTRLQRRELSVVRISRDDRLHGPSGERMTSAGRRSMSIASSARLSNTC